MAQLGERGLAAVTPLGGAAFVRFAFRFAEPEKTPPRWPDALALASAVAAVGFGAGRFAAPWIFVMLVKLYGATSEGAKGRYSPAECTGAIKTPITGVPDKAHISTSYSERQNCGFRRSRPAIPILKPARVPI